MAAVAAVLSHPCAAGGVPSGWWPRVLEIAGTAPSRCRGAGEGNWGARGGLRYRLRGHKALLRLAADICYAKCSHEAWDGGAGVGSPSAAVMPPP